MGNTVSDNSDYGSHLRYSSSNNTLYHNNLIDNTNHNAYDSCTNQWDSGSEGNYYSDYIGTDPDGDGIGDTPYPISGGESIDRYPLMQPWADGTPQKGDLNGDDRITPADAAIALRLAATGAQNPAADVSGDEQVTSLDALIILQAAGGGNNAVTTPHLRTDSCTRTIVVVTVASAVVCFVCAEPASMSARGTRFRNCEGSRWG